MEVSINWGVLFWGPCMRDPIIFGAPSFWKLPYWSPSVRDPSIWVHIKRPSCGNWLKLLLLNEGTPTWGPVL